MRRVVYIQVCAHTHTQEKNNHGKDADELNTHATIMVEMDLDLLHHFGHAIYT